MLLYIYIYIQWWTPAHDIGVFSGLKIKSSNINCTAMKPFAKCYIVPCTLIDTVGSCDITRAQGSVFDAGISTCPWATASLSTPGLWWFMIVKQGNQDYHKFLPSDCYWPNSLELVMFSFTW